MLFKRTSCAKASKSSRGSCGSMPKSLVKSEHHSARKPDQPGHCSLRHPYCTATHSPYR